MRQRAQIDCVAGQLDLRHLGLDHRAVVPRGLGAEHSATTTGQVAQHRATKSSGTSTEISSSGSSKITFVAAAASRNASAPAIWKAKSEESTLWALPSSNVTRISTTG